MRKLAVVHPATGPVTLEDLYREHWAPLVRLGTALAGSRQVAEDVVHDAFVRLDSVPTVPEFPGAYLRRMVVNGVTDYHRRLNVERRHAPRGLPPAVIPEVEEIWATLGTLPERQRTALVLRYQLDLSVPEVADLMACPVNTAKTLIHRGLAHLRRELNP